MEALALSRGELDASRVAVRCVLADRLPLLTGDRVQLQQVIQNLVRNAAEAMIGVQDGPRELTITTRRHEDDRVQLSVRDVGIGFRREDADKLFAPFYTTKTHGMGIGLSVSRSIVEQSLRPAMGGAERRRPGRHVLAVDSVRIQAVDARRERLTAFGGSRRCASVRERLVIQSRSTRRGRRR